MVHHALSTDRQKTGAEQPIARSAQELSENLRWRREGEYLVLDPVGARLSVDEFWTMHRSFIEGYVDPPYGAMLALDWLKDSIAGTLWSDNGRCAGCGNVLVVQGDVRACVDCRFQIDEHDRSK